ncbi:MAG TPA: hypothetical protein VF481_08710 [Novosphingobium sp.]
MSVRQQAFGRRSQDSCDRRLVWHNERGQQLNHVGHAAPFVPGQQSDGEMTLIDDFTADGQPERYFTPLSLV